MSGNKGNPLDPGCFLVSWFLREYADPGLRKLIAHDLEIIESEFDVISGLIADDQMTIALRKFFNNNITDAGLEKCLGHIKYDNQVVSKSSRADAAIKVIKEKRLHGQELVSVKEKAKINMARGNKIVNEIQVNMVTEGKYFANIIKDIKSKIEDKENERRSDAATFHL